MFVNDHDDYCSHARVPRIHDSPIIISELYILPWSSSSYFTFSHPEHGGPALMLKASRWIYISYHVLQRAVSKHLCFVTGPFLDMAW